MIILLTLLRSPLIIYDKNHTISITASKMIIIIEYISTTEQEIANYHIVGKFGR